jgi:hypothetical protein
MKTLPDIACAHLAFEGYFRCVVNEGTDREVDTGWFENLVVDAGLDRLAQTTAPLVFSWSSIGTGTNTPLVSNTSLQAFVADSSAVTVDSQFNDGPTNYPSEFQAHYVYAQGAVVGNMAEVGIGWASGGANLWSRSRILDGSGNPTTLTLISLDQLTIYYRLVSTNPTADVSGSVSISGTPYAYVGRMADAGSFANALFNMLEGGSSVEWGQITTSSGGVITSYDSTSVLGAITGEPSGTSESSGSSTVASYSTGTFYRDSTLTLSPSQGNLSGGIGAMLFNYSQGGFKYQFSFSPPIPKTNTETLTLTARLSWGR